MSIRSVHSARALRIHSRIAIRARRPRRGLDRLHALAGEDRVEDTGELGVAVPDQEAEGADPVAQVHEQVTGLLSGPGAVRVSGHAQDVHPPVPTSMTNSIRTDA